MTELADKIAKMLTDQHGYNFNGFTDLDKAVLNSVTDLAARGNLLSDLFSLAHEKGPVVISHGGAKGCRCMCCTEYTISYDDPETELDRTEFLNPKDCLIMSDKIEQILFPKEKP